MTFLDQFWKYFIGKRIHYYSNEFYSKLCHLYSLFIWKTFFTLLPEALDIMLREIKYVITIYYYYIPFIKHKFMDFLYQEYAKQCVISKRKLYVICPSNTLEKRSLFSPRLWGYFWRLTIYFRIQPGFSSKNSLLGCPNILIFIYFDFLLSKILCYDSPELLHNSA